MQVFIIDGIEYYKVADDVDEEILCVTKPSEATHNSYFNGRVDAKTWKNSRFTNKVPIEELLFLLDIFEKENNKNCFIYVDEDMYRESTVQIRSINRIKIAQKLLKI